VRTIRKTVIGKLLVGNVEIKGRVLECQGIPFELIKLYSRTNMLENTKPRDGIDREEFTNRRWIQSVRDPSFPIVVSITEREMNRSHDYEVGHPR
jgi:hypothetical protein